MSDKDTAKVTTTGEKWWRSLLAAFLFLLAVGASQDSWEIGAIIFVAALVVVVPLIPDVD